jgi:hypothetical protein
MELRKYRPKGTAVKAFRKFSGCHTSGTQCIGCAKISLFVMKAERINQ